MLIVGRDKSAIIRDLPDTFLILDDGPLIDTLTIPKNRKVTRVDVFKDFYNPLQGMDYRRACEFVSVLDAVFPEGENTLTKKTANFVLLNALLSDRKSLRRLIPKPGKGSDTGTIDAYQKIQRLLLSPVLKRFLCYPANHPTFSLDGIVLVRLDRSVLTDFDCFVIANLLISNYQGHVIIPDFGFYGCKFHAALVRQERLRAGVNFLDESPLKNTLLLIKDKVAGTCTADDAHVLASYAGLARDPLREDNDYNRFVQRCIT